MIQKNMTLPKVTIIKKKALQKEDISRKYPIVLCPKREKPNNTLKYSKI